MVVDNNSVVQIEGEAAPQGSEWSVILPYDSKRLTAHKAKNNGRVIIY